MNTGKKVKVGIVDYGLGNLFSVQRALRAVGVEGVISKDHKTLLSMDKLILPGVGTFGAGMTNLKANNLIGVLDEYRQSGKSIFGICLGMQLLLSQSEESVGHKGLDYISGKVVRFIQSASKDEQIKIPQVSWNAINPPMDESLKKQKTWTDTSLEDVGAGDYFYFVHSYYVDVDNEDDCLAQSQYGRHRFCSVVRKDNVMGCQFHPELSAESGLNILKKFVDAKD